MSVRVFMPRRETDGSVWCAGTLAAKTSTQSGMAVSTISKPHSGRRRTERIGGKLRGRSNGQARLLRAGGPSLRQNCKSKAPRPLDARRQGFANPPGRL